MVSRSEQNRKYHGISDHEINDQCNFNEYSSKFFNVNLFSSFKKDLKFYRVTKKMHKQRVMFTLISEIWNRFDDMNDTFLLFYYTHLQIVTKREFYTISSTFNHAFYEHCVFSRLHGIKLSP